MAQRPPSIWQTEALATLYRDVEHALRRYEAYCHEATDRAPHEWRNYWSDEAQTASRTRQHLLHRLIDFMDYAIGKNSQVLGNINNHERSDQVDSG